MHRSCLHCHQEFISSWRRGREGGKGWKGQKDGGWALCPSLPATPTTTFLFTYLHLPSSCHTLYISPTSPPLSSPFLLWLCPSFSLQLSPKLHPASSIHLSFLTYLPLNTLSIRCQVSKLNSVPVVQNLTLTSIFKIRRVRKTQPLLL